MKRIYFHAASVFLSRVLVVAESSDRDLELLQITKKQKTKKNRSFYGGQKLCSAMISVVSH